MAARSRTPLRPRRTTVVPEGPLESTDLALRVTRLLDSDSLDDWEALLTRGADLLGTDGRLLAVSTIRASIAVDLAGGLRRVAPYLFVATASHLGLARAGELWSSLATAEIVEVAERLWGVYGAPAAAELEELDLALLGGGALLASSLLARLDGDSLVEWLSEIAYGLVERSRRLADVADARLAIALLEPVQGAGAGQEAGRLDHLARAHGRLAELGEAGHEDLAMSLHRQAAEVEVDDPAMTATLRNNFAVAIARRFDATGDEALLLEEVATYRDVLDVVDEIDRETLRRNLAGALVRGIDLYGWSTLAEASQLVDAMLDRIRGVDLPPRHEAAIISRALVVARHRFDAGLDDPRLDDVLGATRRLLGVLPHGSPEAIELTVNLLPVLGEQWEYFGDRGARDEARALAEGLVVNPSAGVHERRAALANAGIALADAGAACAVDTFRAAVVESPEGTVLRARALDNLAHALFQQWRATGEERALYESAASYQEALALLPERAGHRPTLLSNAAGTDHELYDHTGRVVHLDAAIDRHRESVARTDPDSHSWPARASNLASVLLTRTTQHGGLHYLYEAIPLARRAVARCYERAIYRPALLNVLADAIRRVAAVTPDSEVFDEALSLYEQAIAASPHPGPERSGRLDNFADALAERGAHEGDASLLHRAVGLREQAIAELDRRAPLRSAIENNLAATLLTRWRLEGDDADLERAISLARTSVEAGTGDDRPVRLAVLGLALAHAARGELAEPTVYDPGVAFAEACSTGIETQPGVVLAAGQLWGDHALRLGRFDEAVTAYVHARGAMRLMVARQQARAPKEQWLADSQDLASGSFCALAASGRATDAALAAEETRALLLVDALRDGAGDDGPDRPPEIVAPVIAPRQAALYLASGHDGGWAVIRSALSDEAVALPGLSRDAVGDRVERHLDLAQGLISGGPEARRAWQRHLVDLVSWLGDHIGLVAGSGMSRLRDIDDLVLVPLGTLALLPWNAAAFPPPDATGNRAWLDEAVTLRHAPNVTSLSLLPPAEASARPPLVVAAPLPSALPSLEPAPEVAAVRAWSLDAEVLEGRQATVGAIAAGLGGRRLAHVVAHGHVEPLEPLHSGFYAADDQLFTVKLLVEHDVPAPALVVLAGCQTALIGRRAPDESVGLPAAFLQAGARGVIAAQWPVTNATAANFMRAFYEALAVTPSPAAALRRAQRSVRTTELSGGRLAGARPFGNPDHWAPFVYWGA